MRIGPKYPDNSQGAEPPLEGFWSGNNNFGNRVAYNPGRNNIQSVLELPQWGYPAVWTATLGLDYSDSSWPSDTQGFEIVAHVQWGTGGASQSCELDWIQGASLTFPADSGIYINAEFVNYDASAVPTDLHLSALIGHYPMSRVAPTRSYKLDAIAETEASAPQRIPPFAKRLYVTDRSVTPLGHAIFLADTTRIIFASGSDAGIVLVQQTVYGSDILKYAEGIPIPGRAKYVIIANDLGSNAAINPNLIFELCL